MKTYADIYTGGALATRGAISAGLAPLWGIERDDAIAQVARANGLHVITADARTVDPTTLQAPDHLHASPPCQSFSQGKTGGEETREDIELAQVVVRFLEAMTPRTFTLENVSMYRFSESWRLIQDALDRLGYWMNVQNHCNAANFGVPQTRKRMIVRAVRGGWLTSLPQPVPWVGWYAAIEDLLPGLPDSEFAPWQLARMPQGLMGALLVDSAGYPDESGARVAVTREAHEPANTIVANHARRPMRAFLATGQYAQSSGHPARQCQTRNDDEPSPTVTASTKPDWRAFIVDSCNANQPTPTIRNADEPTFTVVANAGDKGMPRAFLVSSQSKAGGDVATVDADDPAFTVGINADRFRAAIPGRVARMTPRALARFQSIPDDYILPDRSTLAVRIIGNAVPPLLMRQLLEPFA